MGKHLFPLHTAAGHQRGAAAFPAFQQRLFKALQPASRFHQHFAARPVQSLSGRFARAGDDVQGLFPSQSGRFKAAAAAQKEGTPGTIAVE